MIGSQLAVGRPAGWRCPECGELHRFALFRKLGGQEMEIRGHDSAAEVGELIRSWFAAWDLGPETKVLAMSHDRKGQTTDHGFMHREQAISFLLAPFGVA
jgi:hypothetical protein